jgi:predicted dehydrogenase
MSEIKVGIIGSGQMGQKHALTLKNLEGVKIGGVFSRTLEKARRLATKCTCKYFTNWKELLKEDIDAVWVCTPDNFHKEIVLEALREDKHVFVEKALERTVENAREMSQAAEESKMKTMVGYPLRFHPLNSEIKKLIDSERIGTPLMIWSIRPHFVIPKARLYDRYRDEYHYAPEWAFDRTVGGPIFSHASHDYDLLQWYVGKIEKVYACGDKYLNTEIVDGFVTSVKFENGATGFASTPWIARTGFDHLSVAGRKGTVVLAEDKLVVKIEDEPEYTTSIIKYDIWTREDKHFIDCIRKDEEPLISFDDGLSAVAVGIAALRSVDEKREVKIKEVLEI